jgi:hypothetical protein
MDGFWRSIRENPLSYLPEVSLKAFGHFRNGYISGCAMEGKQCSLEFDARKYWEWLNERFQLSGAGAIGDISIVSSFSANDTEAFHKYFSLLDEFLHLEHAGDLNNRHLKIEKRNFVETIKAIRERPAMYLGSSTFLGLCSYLMGDEHAHRDLKLPVDDGRIVFDGFKQWVETEKNRALPRPWFRVISFRSMGDCGHTQSGAFSIFYKWLDQYASKTGKPKLFHVPVDWDARPVPGSP